MVQCFSGGFADVIYDQADPRRGLSPRNRCGFFATTFDRTAAGCTPDIMLDDYREYSTYFWAALCGHTRTGKPVEQPDFLDDGRIGMSEAHAYTMIHSETVDIPVKTSDTFLRQYSRLPDNRDQSLLSPDIPFDRLCAGQALRQGGAGRIVRSAAAFGARLRPRRPTNGRHAQEDL